MRSRKCGPAEPRDGEMWNTESYIRSLKLVISGATAGSTLWFPGHLSFLLGVYHHTGASDFLVNALQPWRLVLYPSGWFLRDGTSVVPWEGMSAFCVSGCLQVHYLISNSTSHAHGLIPIPCSLWRESPGHVLCSMGFMACGSGNLYDQRESKVTGWR